MSNPRHPIPPRATQRHAALFVLGVTLPALAVLSGCSLISSHTAPPPVAVAAAPPPSALPAHLEALQRLVQSPTADQASLLSAAQQEFESTPSPQHQLRYALLLATPGHAGSNPERAAQLLQSLTTLPPETLTPDEHAFVVVQLHATELALTTSADSQKLRQQLERIEHERAAVANTRRLQQEVEENAKLRKELEDAKAKLKAIAKIERGLTHSSP